LKNKPRKLATIGGIGVGNTRGRSVKDSDMFTDKSSNSPTLFQLFKEKKNMRYINKLVVLFVALAMVLSACGPEKVGGFEIPEVQKGKFNIAMVLIGPHDDGGWSQAHYEGLLYVEKEVPNVHVAYIENVPEGADSEQVFRSLARKGFNLIIGTSFGFGDPMEAVAGEFPDSMFIHLTGIKSNKKNFGNLMGAMENMKYLAGMLAGARAKKDGNPKLGEKPAPNAPWMCAGSTPGTIRSSKRKPRLLCLMPARR
jgi:basic membrane lipoprotein Med (substrate-binding protein (PBP1-ABC) superfamily)